MVRFVSTVLLGLLLSHVAHADFSVVLGSYADRTIAVEQLLLRADANIDRQSSQLLIMVSESANQTYFRVVAGPYDAYTAAQAELEKWLQRGLSDAWITNVELPQMLDTPKADPLSLDEEG